MVSEVVARLVFANDTLAYKTLLLLQLLILALIPSSLIREPCSSRRELERKWKIRQIHFRNELPIVWMYG